jgi:hypothetical protein
VTALAVSESGGRFRDLTGKRFGCLTAIRSIRSEPGKVPRERRWVCSCDCGGEVITPRALLVRGHRIQCDDCRPRYADLTGQPFDRLTVLRDVTAEWRRVRGGYNSYFLCRCACGREPVVTGGNLLSGFSRSCGGCNRKRGTCARILRWLRRNPASSARDVAEGLELAPAWRSVSSLLQYLARRDEVFRTAMRGEVRWSVATERRQAQLGVIVRGMGGGVR